MLFLKDKRKIIASRSLKEMEEILEDYPFIRVHHSHVVNINEVEKYIKGEGGYLIMSDGSSVNVSRSKKDFAKKTFFAVAPWLYLLIYQAAILYFMGMPCRGAAVNISVSSCSATDDLHHLVFIKKMLISAFHRVVQVMVILSTNKMQWMI